jgi:hypothetical protein
MITVYRMSSNIVLRRFSERLLLRLLFISLLTILRLIEEKSPTETIGPLKLVSENPFQDVEGEGIEPSLTIPSINPTHIVCRVSGAYQISKGSANVFTNRWCQLNTSSKSNFHC